MESRLPIALLIVAAMAAVSAVLIRQREGRSRATVIAFAAGVAVVATVAGVGLLLMD